MMLLVYLDTQTMKQQAQTFIETHEYQSPMIYVGVFYTALIAWTIACVLFISIKVIRSELGSTFNLFMIAFIIGMTWYFSMGISYRVFIEEDGTLRFTSFRRVLRIDSKEMELVEGPHLPIGFIRFRVGREKAYLFCKVKNKKLQEILLAIRNKNPDIQFKNLNITL